MKNWKWYEQLNSQVRLVDFQEISGRADQVYYEQQKHMTWTDEGFEIAGKFHEQVKMQLERFNSQMDDHAKRLTQLEMRIVEYHQKTQATYKCIESADNENIRRIERKLDNVAGDMHMIKNDLSKIIIKMNNMEKDTKVDKNES